MKKLLALTVVLTITVLTMACSSSANASNVPTLGSGKKMKLKFDTNPTTGYEWQYKTNEGGGAVILTDESYESSDPTGKLMGAGGYSTYTFVGSKKGHVTLTFTYLRHWDAGSALYDVVYELEVDDNLNIACMSKNKGVINNEKELSEFPDPVFE